MPTLSLWSIIAILICIVTIVISLVLCIFKYRRCPRSTVDPVEYISDHKKIKQQPKQKKEIQKIDTSTTTTAIKNKNDFYSHHDDMDEKNSTPTPTTTTSTLFPTTPAALDDPLSEKQHDFLFQKESSSFQEFNLSLPLPPPTTSFFSDKMELNSDEANRLYELYMASSTHNNDKKQHITIDMNGTNLINNTNNNKSLAATIKSTFRQSLGRQKSISKKTNIYQLFDTNNSDLPITTNNKYDNTNLDIYSTINKNSSATLSTNIVNLIKDEINTSATTLGNNNSGSDVLELSKKENEKANIEQDKKNQTNISQQDTVSNHHKIADADNNNKKHIKGSPSIATTKSVTNSVRPSLHDITSWWSLNEKSETNSLHHSSLTKEESLHSFHDNGSSNFQVNLSSTATIDDVSSLFQSNQPTTPSKSPIDEPYSFSPNSTCSRATLKRYRKALLEQAALDNGEEDEEDDSGDDDDGDNDDDDDDDDEKSSDDSIGDNIRFNLSHSNVNEMVHDNISNHDNGNSECSSFSSPINVSNGNYSDDDLRQNENDFVDETLSYKNDKIPTIEVKSYPLSTIEINPYEESNSYHAENKLDDYTMHRLSMFSAASDNTIQPLPSVPIHQNTVVIEEVKIKAIKKNDQEQKDEKIIYSQYQDNEIKVEPPEEKDENDIDNHSKPSLPQETYQHAFDKSVTSISTVIQQSGPYISTSSLTKNSNNVDSVRRILHSTWNSNRLSENGSISSKRSTLSQGKSPPGSINPRQLNKYLASLSLRGQQQQQQQRGTNNRPGLPTGFMVNSDEVDIQGPVPTASFSSSTVRTMIPEDEPLESHLGKKTTATTVTNPKVNDNSKNTPIKESASTKIKEKQPFGTIKTNQQQQRAPLPWNTAKSKKSNNSNSNDKTPAQRERDRYLKSLKK